MSDRYPGGIITKTPVTPAGPYAEGSAPGVWTLEQQAYWQAQGLWPNASNPTPNDPYFQYVTSLLHGDGTNGGQNNTFLDSSTNAFTITRNGNTTQGIFSPYGSNWGNYFDGSNAYLTLASNSAFDLGSNDFTLEAWCFPQSTSNGIVITRAANGSTYPTFELAIYSGTWRFYSSSSGSSYNVSLNSGVAPFLNQWQHVAVTRNGSTYTIWINGTAAASTTSSASLYANSSTVGIGAYPDNTNKYTGYISNLRLVSGTAVYTSAFTPSATPLTAVSGTQLLTCQSNRFIDNSANAFALTVGGTPQVTRFSPFAPTYATQYSASTIGGSGYFDNSGDYLSVANNSALQLGSSDFTIDFWWYPTELDNDHRPLQGFVNSGSTRTYLFLYAGLDKLKFYASSTGSTWDIASARDCGTPIKNQWNFVRAIRSGSTWTFYMNGTQTDTFTSSASIYNGSEATEIGGTSVSNQSVQGYLTDVRIIKGTALTNSIPTSPLTAVTNTSLLLNYTNGAIYDNAMIPNYETVGNAQISTSVKKYGTGSLAFDGTGDYLSTPNASNFNFGTGNFTVEMWIYLTTEGSDQFFAGGDTNGNWNCGFLTSNKTIRFGRINAAWDATSTPVSVVNTWNHVVFCRAGGYLKIFFNGTQVYGGSNTQDYNITNTLIVASDRGTGRYVNGYIDDFRITKGYARYWENFTPPAAALPNFGGAYQVPTQDPQFNYTTLLLPGNGTNGAQNNTFLDSSTNAFTITRNGNTTQGTFTPFSQTGWSNNMDGSGSYLTAPSSSNLDMGSGDFTIECWSYFDSIKASRPFSGLSSYYAFAFYMPSDGVMRAISYQTVSNTLNFEITGPTLTAGNWYHLACTRSGNTVRYFVNGTLAGSATYSGTIESETSGWGIGAGPSGTDIVNGYVSNLRVVKGTALYTANFTPSTTPLTAVSGTQLLTCQSNRFIDNSTNAFAITTNGYPQVQAFSPFAPTAAYSASTVGGSGYFDGTGDYLSVADNAAFALGTNNFTVDGWAWIDSNSSQGVIIAQDTGTISTSSFRVEWDGTIKGRVYIGGTQYTLTGTSDRRNTWVHFALVRNGSTVYLYVNGVQEATASVSTDSINDSSGALTIGATSTGGTRPTGYISNVRLVNGTAVYTTAFTPPTAPTTAITNTALLVNFTNAGITDATAKNALETVGNAQISTTQSKFGGSSIYLDGTDDKIIAAYQPWMNFGTGDFTVEMWINFGTALASLNDNSGIYVYRSSSLESTSCNIRTRQTPGIAVQLGATDTNFSWNPTTGTWYHMAIVRYNGTLTMYVNGNSIGSGSNSGNVAYESGYFLTIGGNPAVSTLNINAYINDLRVTKGYARYVQNFTPPAQADQLY